MNKKDEIKIEVLSGIDEQIIEKQTEKRIRLMLKNKYSRMKLVGWCSGAAACLLVIFSVLFSVLLPPSFMMQVPVYEGMTVSNNKPSTQMFTDIPNTEPLSLSGDFTETRGVALLLERRPVSRATRSLLLAGERESVSESAPESVTENRLEFPEVTGDNRALYYANRNQDIYITVHINNPDSFDILSFTLNGVKYQSYMFEDGSDSENLILKVNVGDAAGMVEYTIDAIKYVDGTEIKDVRMDGERSVWVGVYPDAQPTPTIENKVIESEELRFDVLLEDSLSLIKESGGEVVAVLRDGESLVGEVKLSLDEVTSVSFVDLTPGKKYVYRIIASYDSLDGKGFGSYVLYEEAVMTSSLVQITDVAVTDTTNVSFDFHVADDSVVIEKVELLSAVGGIVASGDGSVRCFDGVSIGRFTIRVTYTYGESGSRTGYAFSDQDIEILSFGNIERIVRDGSVSRKSSGDSMIYNPSTGSYKVHPGIDIIATGSDKGVYVTFSGEVTEALNGRVEVVSFDGSVRMVYDSLLQIAVSKGDTVAFGQRLGEVGNTSATEFADEDHVHIEVWIDGECKDPMDYFEN